MSHTIDTSNGRHNMAYVGKTPWHGVGQKVLETATIEEWAEAAGLEWEIEKRAVFHGIIDENGNKKAKTIENRKALVRDDTQECLSIMSKDYKVVQPREILEFYRDLVEGSGFTIETAGSLKGGAKIWALARGNKELNLDGDRVVSYLLLATACDGTMSTVAMFTTVRVVCNNTLTMAVGANGSKAAIRVPHSRKFDADEVKEQLGLVSDRFETFSADVSTLADRKVSDTEAIQYFINQYAKVDDKGEVTNEKHLKSVTGKLLKLYRTGPGADLPAADGTAWGLVNAVTRYEDFDSGARSNENRFHSAQFGVAANRKVKAFDGALALATDPEVAAKDVHTVDSEDLMKSLLNGPVRSNVRRTAMPA